MKLGVLDFGVIQTGSNAISTIHETLSMAQRAEELGFSKYWLAEHHGKEMAWRDPVLIMTIIAGFTDQINIGSAGVLLPVSNPLRISQNFKLLENLFPNRIDLGLARGFATPLINSELLENGDLGENAKKHPERISKIISLLNSKEDEIASPPINGTIPSVWILSTSANGINLAVQNDCNFSLSLFHNIQALPEKEIIAKLKEEFYRTHKRYPKINVAIAGACCSSSEQAEKLINSYTNIKVNIAGVKDDVLESIHRIKNDYGVDEIIWLDVNRDYNEKLSSLETISTLIS